MTQKFGETAQSSSGMPCKQPTQMHEISPPNLLALSWS